MIVVNDPPTMEDIDKLVKRYYGTMKRSDMEQGIIWSTIRDIRLRLQKLEDKK